MRSAPVLSSDSTRWGELLREIWPPFLLERVSDPRLQELTITEVEMSRTEVWPESIMRCARGQSRRSS